MEEEAKIRYGNVFSPAEREFFRHRLLSLYPKIDKRGVKTALDFLEQQKAVNCPCSVHTEQRGYEWIVFRRQPDRKPCEDEEDEDDINPIDEVSDDEDFFSAEAEETILTPTSDERTQVDQDILDDIIGAASETTPEEADFSSADLSNGYKTMAKPQMSESLCELYLHSGDKTNSKPKIKTDQNKKKKNDDSKSDENPMDLEVNIKEGEDILLDTPKRKSGGFYYNPLLYCTSSTGKTYYFKYFRAYPYDHRMLLNDDYGEPIKCQCPKGKIHHKQCPWYNPDVIYIIDIQEDLSPSELAA